MIRRPPRSTLDRSSAASDVYKRQELAKENINAEVIDLRSVRPIDYATVINSVKKTNRLVIVEESWPLAAIATEVTFKVQKLSLIHI